VAAARGGAAARGLGAGAAARRAALRAALRGGGWAGLLLLVVACGGGGGGGKGGGRHQYRGLDAVNETSTGESVPRAYACGEGKADSQLTFEMWPSRSLVLRVTPTSSSQASRWVLNVLLPSRKFPHRPVPYTGPGQAARDRQPIRQAATSTAISASVFQPERAKPTSTTSPTWTSRDGFGTNFSLSESNA
jgi:hypothetical protein